MRSLEKVAKFLKIYQEYVDLSAYPNLTSFLDQVSSKLGVAVSEIQADLISIYSGQTGDIDIGQYLDDFVQRDPQSLQDFIYKRYDQFLKYQ